MPSTAEPLSKMAGSTVGAAGVVDAAGAAGDDEAFAAGDLTGRSLTGKDLGVDAQFPDFAGNQVAVLTAGIEYRDLGCVNGCSVCHFARRCTMTRFT